MPAVEQAPTVSPEVLAEIALFGGLSAAALEYLLPLMRHVTLQEGDVLFCEGDSGTDLYVVLEGAVSVSRSCNGQMTEVAVLGAGQWFGEGSVLAMQPRSATIAATGPTQLLRIAASTLNQLYRHDIKAYALFVLNVARDLGRQLRSARKDALARSER